MARFPRGGMSPLYELMGRTSASSRRLAASLVRARLILKLPFPVIPNSYRPKKTWAPEIVPRDPSMTQDS
jgi:hypothetical protein